MTKKHIELSNDQIIIADENIRINIKQFDCECGNIYKLRQGLYKHKKQCNKPLEYTDDNDTDKDTLIQLLLKEKEQVEIEKEELQKQFEKDKDELKKQVETEKLRSTNQTYNNAIAARNKN